MILSLTEERGGVAAKATDGTSTATATAINTMKRRGARRRRPRDPLSTESGVAATRTGNSDLMESRLPFVAGRQTERVPAVGPDREQAAEDHHYPPDPKPADQRVDVHLHIDLAGLGRVVEHHHIHIARQRGDAVDARPGLILGEVVLADRVHHPDVFAVLLHAEGGAAHLLLVGAV